MLTITDLGCDQHNRRQVTLNGVEAEMMTDFLYNLTRDGDFHTYICECGHTHHICFNTQVKKLFRLSDRFSKKMGRSWRQKPGPGQAGQAGGISTTL